MRSVTLFLVTTTMADARDDRRLPPGGPERTAEITGRGDQREGRATTGC